MVEACDIVPTDQCCGVIPCVLCLVWTTDYDVAYGKATFGDSSWSGTVGGISFVAYWERGYESDECEFVVTLDGEEVYRSTCYEGASCRDPAGEAEATIDYEDGIISWSVYEPRELQLTDNPDTGCRDFFCGSCRCSCDCLCVTITEAGGDTITGEICDVAYDCDPPTWEGTLGYFALSLKLGRDDYGECIITPTVNGEELEPVAADGCGDMSATFETYEGDVISVRCKQCSCDDTYPCCDGASLPATIHLTLISMNTECGCLDGVVVPLNATSVVGSRVTYVGVLRNPCVINGDTSKAYYYKFTVNCGAPESFESVVIETIEGIPVGDPEPELEDSRWVVQTTYLKTSGQCDPFYFYYALDGPGESQNDIWLNCENTSMETPWIELEITR